MKDVWQSASAHRQWELDSRKGHDNKQILIYPRGEQPFQMPKQLVEAAHSNFFRQVCRVFWTLRASQRRSAELGRTLRFLKIERVEILHCKCRGWCTIEFGDTVYDIERMCIVTLGQEEFGRFPEMEHDESEDKDEEGDSA